jgi:hypothetical protein
VARYNLMDLVLMPPPVNSLAILLAPPPLSTSTLTTFFHQLLAPYTPPPSALKHPMNSVLAPRNDLASDGAGAVQDEDEFASSSFFVDHEDEASTGSSELLWQILAGNRSRFPRGMSHEGLGCWSLVTQQSDLCRSFWLQETD